MFDGGWAQFRRIVIVVGAGKKVEMLFGVILFTVYPFAFNQFESIETV